MKQLSHIGFIFLIFICASCNKTETLTVVQPQNPNVVQDSASLIFITSNVNTSGNGYISTYGVIKDKKWEIATSAYSYLNPNDLSFKKYLNNSVIIGKNRSTELLSYDANTGIQNWVYNDFSGKLTYGLLVSSGFNNDTILIAASTLASNNYRSALILLNQKNGGVILDYTISEQPLVSPILNGNKIYILTINSSGTRTTLNAFDISSKSIVWQKILSSSFLTSLPSQMSVSGDTLIVTSGINTLNFIDKKTGAIYWSKDINADNVFFYKNQIVYNDKSVGKVTVLNTQNGTITLQGASIPSTKQNGLTYIFNDEFYNKVKDTIYCSSLIDGSIKWKKVYKDGSFAKFIVIGNKLYASKVYDIYYGTSFESKLMIMDPTDFSAKDSIIVPRSNLVDFSILSSSNKYYQ